MIALISRDGDRSFHVYNNGEPLGHIRLQRGLTGEKYLATVDKDGEGESVGREFNSPEEALKWIEKQITF